MARSPASTVMTRKGMATNASATTAPAVVNGSETPKARSSHCPASPFLPKARSRATPPTTGGRTIGNMTSARTRLRPRKRTRASSHASGTPSNTETATAPREHTSESRRAVSTPGAVSSAGRWRQGARTTSAMSGRARNATARTANGTKPVGAAAPGRVRRGCGAPSDGRRRGHGAALSATIESPATTARPPCTSRSREGLCPVSGCSMVTAAGLPSPGHVEGDARRCRSRRWRRQEAVAPKGPLALRGQDEIDERLRVALVLGRVEGGDGVARGDVESGRDRDAVDFALRGGDVGDVGDAGVRLAERDFGHHALHVFLQRDGEDLDLGLGQRLLGILAGGDLRGGEHDFGPGVREVGQGPDALGVAWG